MSGFDLLAASIGLAASALAAALLLPLWRRAPVPAYRLAVSVLAAALALPLLQWGARALDLPVPHPVRDLALAFGAGEAEPALREPAVEPQAPTVSGERAEALPAAARTGASSLPTTAPEATPAPEPPEAHALPWTTILLGLWAAGGVWALARTLKRLSAARRLFARAQPVEDAARLAVWDAVRAGSRVGARTRLCQSTEVRTPACAGLWRPAVVLPAEDSLAGRPELLACVLTHELVHLERRDPWVLVGEELLRAAFWFHPAAWWLVARLGALRELSCDCLVVRRTGKRKRYASALVEYATWMQGPAPRASWAAVVPWSESRGHLTRRIEMLLQQDTGPKRRIVAPAAVGVLMTFLWSGQLALATSSCAGTREGHEHSHAHAHAARSTGEGGSCEGTLATHDGKQHRKVVVDTTGSHAPIVVSPVEVALPDGHGTIERHVVVLKAGGGEAKVLQGDEAKAWIEEHAVKVDAEKAHSKKELVEEIRGAWRHVEGGEPVEVIVIGPDGAKRAKGMKLRKSQGQGVGSGDGQPFGGVWRFHAGQDGKVHEGWVPSSKSGSFTFGFGEGHHEKFKKAQGGLFGGAHGGEAAPEATPGFGGLFERSEAGGADLEALRRELEATRAALEEQRQMLEELRLQLQKQREKADTVGAWMR